MRLPLTLRLFWGVYSVITLLGLALLLGPYVETAIAPVRSRGEIEDAHREVRYVRFVWDSRKLRMVNSPGVDVTMEAAGDTFDLALYHDISEPGGPPCTQLHPWARSQAVALGRRQIPFCVEIPPTVPSTASIDVVRVVAKYRGLGGLWTLYVPLPLIENLK